MRSVFIISSPFLRLTSPSSLFLRRLNIKYLKMCCCSQFSARILYFKLMKYVSAIVSSYWFNVCESTNHFNCFKLKRWIEDIARMECENQFTDAESMLHDFSRSEKIPRKVLHSVDEKLLIVVKYFVIFESKLLTRLHARWFSTTLVFNAYMSFAFWPNLYRRLWLLLLVFISFYIFFSPDGWGLLSV